MRIERFIIRYPRTREERARWSKQYGLNAIYAGKHWSQRDADKQAWRLITWNAMNAARIGRNPFEGPVDITMSWNDGLDIDNHAYMGKMIVDAMRGRLLRDDSRRYVRSVTHRFHAEDYILVEVKEVQGGE